MPCFQKIPPLLLGALNQYNLQPDSPKGRDSKNAPKDHLLMAPEIEVSGLAVYAMEAALDVSECIMEYAILVAGAPQNVPW